MPTGPEAEQTIPIVQETVRVGTRPTERDRVVVHKSVHTRDEVVDVPLNFEELKIERVPIGREVDVAPQVREDGDTLIIPVLEERSVVEKRLILVEEVRVQRVQRQCSAHQTVRLRREQVVVSHKQPDGNSDEKEPNHGDYPEHS